MSLEKLTIEQLHRAIAIKQEIEHLEEKLAALMGGMAVARSASAGGRGSKPKGRRKMSAEARAKIAAAARARWAKHRSGDKAINGKKLRRKMSAQAKARMAAAAKARWAAAKAAGKNRL
jgi:hypothetical protein